MDPMERMLTGNGAKKNRQKKLESMHAMKRFLHLGVLVGLRNYMILDRIIR